MLFQLGKPDLSPFLSATARRRAWTSFGVEWALGQRVRRKGCYGQSRCDTSSLNEVAVPCWTASISRVFPFARGDTR